VSRQYASWSIGQLEEEFERAQDSGDRAAVEKVLSELRFRTTPKARTLLQAAERFLGVAEKPRSEPRGAAKPPPNAQAGPAPKPFPAAKGKPTRKPTAEQQQAIDQFQRGGSVKINAYAGTGKTSTLEFLAQSTSRRGQYIAFNRDIVRDAKGKFPNTVNCSTSHGLAFKATPSAYRNNSEKMTKRVNANQLAEMLNLKRGTLTAGTSYNRGRKGISSLIRYAAICRAPMRSWRRITFPGMGRCLPRPRLPCGSS
jgi:Tfp pilus assembly protein PilX